MVTHTSVGDNVDLVSATAAERVLSGEREGPQKGGLFEKLLGREVEARAAETEASENGDLLPVREGRPDGSRGRNSCRADIVVLPRDWKVFRSRTLFSSP